MKCLIFSDSHGSGYYIEQALSIHRDTEVAFFLGDGLSDISVLSSKYSGIAWLSVRGNCDFYVSAPDFGRITLEGKRIYYSHGDRHGVKSGMSTAESFAEQNGVDIYLFGHTHIPYEKYKDGIYYFNPGSIKGGCSLAPSYGVMQIDGLGVLFSHGSLV